MITDRTSPIVYGQIRNHLPVYYKANGGPLFSIGGRPGQLPTTSTVTAGRGANYQATQPMGASQNVFGTWDPTKDWTGFVPPRLMPLRRRPAVAGAAVAVAEAVADEAAVRPLPAAQFGGRGGGGGGSALS